MLLSIANLTNGLRGLKHNDDVPFRRFQAVDRELQATHRSRCHKELFFYGTTYSATKSINKARVSTGCTVQDIWLVGLICIKPSLFIKQEGEEARLIEVF